MTATQPTTKPMFYVRAVNDVEGIIEGYLAVWGDPRHTDAFDTWFDRQHPPDFGIEPDMPLRLMYEHAQDPEIQWDTIGKVFRVWVDDVGVRFQAQLKKSSKWFSRILSEVKQGLLGVSTGSAPHLALFDNAGRFVKWLLSEVSLTQEPAEPRMPSVALIRSLPADMAEGGRDAPGSQADTSTSETVHDPMEERQMPEELMAALQPLIDQFGLEAVLAVIQQMSGGEMMDVAPERSEAAPAAAGAGTPAPVAPAAPAASATPVTPAAPAPANASDTGKPAQNLDLSSFVAQLTQQLQQQAEAQRSKNELATLRKEMEDLKRSMQTAPATPRNATPNGGTAPNSGGGAQRHNISVGSKFDHLSLADLLYGHGVLSSAQTRGQSRGRGVSEEYLRAVAFRWFKEANADPGSAWNEMVSTRTLPVTRADEIMQTDLTGYGDEWVGQGYEQQLVEMVRVAPIIQRLRSAGMIEMPVPQGQEGVYVPLEGSDPIVYNTPQTTDMTSSGQPDAQVEVSRIGTSRAWCTPAKLSVASAFNGELEEDSLIPMLAHHRMKHQRAIEEAVEYVFINGDTTLTASSNINLIDGTPSARAKYTAFEGFLHIPLVDTTANARACSTLDDEDFALLFPLLGDNGKYAVDRERLFFIVDSGTHDAAVRIPAFKTHDVYNSLATISAGKLLNAYSVPVMVSGQMPLANSAGKVSATAGNNTYGRILLVRPDRFVYITKREASTETDRVPLADSNTVITHIRLGLKRVDAEGAALTYAVPLS